jgi:hypothetical protein
MTRDGNNKKSCKYLILLARLEGFEPPTYGLEVRCSIQLSYRRRISYFLIILMTLEVKEKANLIVVLVKALVLQNYNSVGLPSQLTSIINPA